MTRQSLLFTKTRREAPKDEVAKNAQLLVRAGFIHKEMAGVYSYLPLGLRTLNNIMSVIREEMNAIGGQEISLTALQDPGVWETSGRWNDIDVWFRTELAGGKTLGLAATHEEPLTVLLKDHIASHRDLPRYIYQFQTKFRNELRAKSGIMRTREFIMKDLYSFSRSEEEFREFYEQCAEAYARIFARMGLGDRTYRTFASGGSFSKYSDEFQTESDAGEDIIYVHDEKKIAVNKEVFTDEVLADLGFAKEELREAKAIEVGNIFPLGTRFSETFDLTYKDEAGAPQHVFMGSYGIGPGRLMGTIAEVLSDEKGIVWPKEIAPYDVHLIAIPGKSEDVTRDAEELYDELTRRGIEVLFDDRDMRAGEKFADADIIGIPQRIILSEKTMAQGGVECINRKTGEVQMVPESEIVDRLLK